MNEPVTVVCPRCFEEFEVMPPPAAEMPCEWDYDCEVCCHPMMILFESEDGEIYAAARGLSD